MGKLKLANILEKDTRKINGVKFWYSGALVEYDCMGYLYPAAFKII